MNAENVNGPISKCENSNFSPCDSLEAPLISLMERSFGKPLDKMSDEELREYVIAQREIRTSNQIALASKQASRRLESSEKSNGTSAKAEQKKKLDSLVDDLLS